VLAIFNGDSQLFFAYPFPLLVIGLEELLNNGTN
jgi:hypothetical protein